MSTKANTRSTTNAPSVTDTDAFFKNLPTNIMRELMRDSTTTFLEQMVQNGRNLSEIKDSNNIAC